MATPVPPTTQSTAADRAQYAHDTIDSTIPIEQWLAWDGSYDSKCPRDRPYRSEHVGTGAAVSGTESCVEKPPNSFVDAQGQEWGPWGDKVGVNVTAASGRYNVATGGAEGGVGQPAAPPSPVTFGKAGELTYTGDPLTDMLLYQFNTQRSLDQTYNPNLFGRTEGRVPGVPTTTPENAPFQDVTGKLLSGGGLWWSGDTAAFGQPATPAPTRRNRGGGGGVDVGSIEAIGALTEPPPPAGETPMQNMLMTRLGGPKSRETRNPLKF